LFDRPKPTAGCSANGRRRNSSPGYKIDDVIMGFVDDFSEHLAIMLSYSVEFPNGIQSLDSDTNVRPLHNHVVRNVGRGATSIPCQYQQKQSYNNTGYN
jgi:hypothetical protein